MGEDLVGIALTGYGQEHSHLPAVRALEVCGRYMQPTLIRRFVHIAAEPTHDGRVLVRYRTRLERRTR
jgi:hypothetical protein